MPAEIIGYEIDIRLMDQLKDVNSVLYSSETLSHDDRRDLANRLNALIGKCYPITKRED